jgi:hypothetical protein
MNHMMMIETFIPTLVYCNMKIEFSEKYSIAMFFSKEKRSYCLFNLNEDKETFFETKEELLQAVKTFLDKYQINEIEIAGLSSPGTFIYQK